MWLLKFDSNGDEWMAESIQELFEYLDRFKIKSFSVRFIKKLDTKGKVRELGA